MASHSEYKATASEDMPGLSQTHCYQQLRIQCECVSCATDAKGLQIQALTKGHWLDSSLQQHFCYRLKRWQWAWPLDKCFGVSLRG